ncbi:MAG: hypothetical protein Q7U04_12950 [Bacteriovorax sp.]|nr:hypothetical protein [Bacteriovorax sp.]
MQILILFLTLCSSSWAIACSDILVNYPVECKAQGRYQRLSKEFNNYSIKIDNLKGYKILKAVGKTSYYALKNDFLNNTDATLLKSRDWQMWNNGQNFIAEMSPVLLDFSDITKLHKKLFAEKGFFNNPTDLGKLRTNNAETNPKIIISCNDNFFKEKIFNLFTDYDLKSAEGYSLLTLDNIKVCDDKKLSSFELYFYKGASVKTELVRWLNDFNDMLTRFEKNDSIEEITPFNYLTDMRRWFLAISPFSYGNDEVASALIDYATKRLQLVPISFRELSDPIYLSVEENRLNTDNKIQQTLDFFEGCLYERKTNLISNECNSI